MATRLLQIIEAIQAWQLTTIGGVAINTPSLANLPIKPASGDLPIRIVSPVINRIAAKSSKPLTLRGGRVYEWEIEDLFLFKPVTSTEGFAESAYPIVHYVQSYSVVLEANINPLQGVTIEDTPLEMGIIEYPKTSNGSGVLYGGVCYTLKIKELT